MLFDKKVWMWGRIENIKSNISVMDNIKDTLIEQCLVILKREDVKNELKQLMKPMIDLILQELYPYIFLSIVFVFISFLLILGIFVLLLRNKILIKPSIPIFK
jgi:hypothetical protein